MYMIYYHTNTRHEFRQTETLWGANLLAYKFVEAWGWDRAEVVDAATGEILRSYVKG